MPIFTFFYFKHSFIEYNHTFFLSSSFAEARLHVSSSLFRSAREVSMGAEPRIELGLVLQQADATLHPNNIADETKVQRKLVVVGPINTIRTRVPN
jgi:hypothetical protein